MAARPVVRWELNSRDPRAQQHFYRELFDWSIDADNPAGYGYVTTGDAGMPGGIGPEPHYGTRIYVQVPDVADALARAREFGAGFTDGPAELGGFVLGVFDDPEGNRIGLVQE
ncbi:MAG: VOC family protein [Dermatophilaceae bacterium]